MVLGNWDDLLGNPPNKIYITQGELLLLDWILCSASRLLMDATLDELINNWGEFREKVWLALSQIKQTIEFDITESEARVLLVCVPTTFRWSTESDDCGKSLKEKLSKFLRGEEDGSSSEDEANSTTEGGASA